MSMTREPALYDELLDMLAASSDAERVLAFRLSPSMQAKLDDLLERNRAGALSEGERAELDEFERIEHLVRLLKARLRGKSAL